MKLEFELLLRRSDTVRPGASGDLTFEMNGGHGNVSPLNSDCNSPDGLVPGIQLEEFQKLINFRDSQKNISSTNCRSSLFNGLNTDEHLDSSQHAIDIKRTQFEDYDISKSRKTTLRERLKLLH